MFRVYVVLALMGFCMFAGLVWLVWLTVALADLVLRRVDAALARKIDAAILDIQSWGC